MNHDRPKISRNYILRGLALAPIAVAAALAAGARANAAATAMGHLPKSSVQYQETPKDGNQCSTCKLYINNSKSKTADGGCTQVAGSIKPKAWCVVYSKGDNSKQTL
jgi:hypothetical protein